MMTTSAAPAAFSTLAAVAGADDLRRFLDGFRAVDGRALEVTGTAWFDHQWGDFIAVGGGGWDWFAVNLAGAMATFLVETWEAS